MLAALSAYSHFTWTKAVAALLLFSLGMLLIREGTRTAGNGAGGDGPDLIDLADAALDFGDLLDD